MTFNQGIDETRRGFGQPRQAVSPNDILDQQKSMKAKTLSSLPSPGRPATALASRNEREDLTVLPSINPSSMQQVSVLGTLSMCRCQLTQVPYKFEEILSGIASTQTFSKEQMITFKGYLNCMQCGAFAFKPEGNPATSQYCYVSISLSEVAYTHFYFRLSS